MDLLHRDRFFSGKPQKYCLDEKKKILFTQIIWKHCIMPCLEQRRKCAPWMQKEEDLKHMMFKEAVAC